MALLASAALAAGAGCRKRVEPPPRVSEVRVVVRDAAGEVPSGVRVEDLEARAASRMGAAGVVAVDSNRPPRSGVDYRLSVEVRLLDGVEGSQGVLRALLQARLARVGGASTEAAIRNDLVAEREHPAEQAAAPAEVRAHLERALDDGIDGLVRLARVRLGSPADRLAALGSDDEELRREAARGVGERKEREAVATLVRMLKDPKPEVRDLALGTLIEIGDPAAARPIAEMARLGDAAQLPRIIDAMATLGGAEARAYLEFVISSHDDEELRAMARSALARLDQRESSQKPPGGAP